jgi:hypothetical protein
MAQSGEMGEGTQREEKLPRKEKERKFSVLLSRPALAPADFEW